MLNKKGIAQRIFDRDNVIMLLTDPDFKSNYKQHMWIISLIFQCYMSLNKDLIIIFNPAK